LVSVSTYAYLSVNAPATTELYTLSLHDALPILSLRPVAVSAIRRSVIDPESGADNLAYSHRVLEASRAVGADVVSFGQHRPLTRSEEHTSELQSRENLVCRLLLEKKNKRSA